MITAAAQNRLDVYLRKLLLNQEEFFKRYRRRGSSGSFKRYMPITESWGIKFCEYQLTIETNYERQRKAHDAGFGPYCFGLSYHEAIGYYYFTEIVNCAVEYRHLESPTFNRLKNLFKKILEFDFTDASIWNVGFINKTLVCIDFDNTRELVSAECYLE